MGRAYTTRFSFAVLTVVATVATLLLLTPTDVTARQWGPGPNDTPESKNARGPTVVSAVDVGAGGGGVGAAQAPRKGSGCHKGWCWKWCDATIVQGEWCYTNSPHSTGGQRCSRNDECRDHWPCSGICSL